MIFTVLRIPVGRAAKVGSLVAFFASIPIIFVLQIQYIVTPLKEDFVFMRVLGISLFVLLSTPFICLAIGALCSALIAMVYNYVAKKFGGIELVLNESPK